jgi:hypothetical protein
VRKSLVIVAATCMWLIGLTASAEAAPMSCTVSAPISAAQLNEPTDGTWHFEVFNAQPNSDYKVKVNWPGDPSNGAHTNAGIITDSTGYGITVLQRYWSPDGFLPGYFAFHDPYDPMSGFVAVPGEFSVQVGPKLFDGTIAGKANCDGTVLP